MTVIVHHLNNSRSQRILWLLEEIGADYGVKVYARDPVTNLAPPALLAVHPLGKSPVVEHAGNTVFESGAIVEYLCARVGGDHLVPDRGSADYVRYLEWMHFAEGSAMTPVLLQLYTNRLGDAAVPLQPRITSELESHFAFMESQISPSGHFIGSSLTAADIMLSFPAEIAIMQGRGEAYPKLQAFVTACHARPAWQRAAKRGEAAYYSFS
ncbi:MAG: glutathione S-transferase [Sphingopyxis sp.]|nr:glutathione S-transferase [Sphingopyxis sp.]